MFDLKTTWIGLFASVACALAASGTMAQDVTYGESLFKKNCAVCHGATAAGDGPVAELFEKKPRNLQLLSKDNNGAFPFSEVYQAIDGRREIAGHGNTEMPVWGDLFYSDALPQTFHPGVDAEDFVQARILALVYFLQTMQN